MAQQQISLQNWEDKNFPPSSLFQVSFSKFLQDVKRSITLHTTKLTVVSTCKSSLLLLLLICEFQIVQTSKVKKGRTSPYPPAACFLLFEAWNVTVHFFILPEILYGYIFINSLFYTLMLCFWRLYQEYIKECIQKYIRIWVSSFCFYDYMWLLILFF